MDSFYSLLRSGRKVDLLVAVHGFDIKLGDAPRAASFEESLRRVAAAVGARPVVVRPNLREHPAFARPRRGSGRTAGRWRRSATCSAGGSGGS